MGMDMGSGQALLTKVGTDLYFFYPALILYLIAGIVYMIGIGLRRDSINSIATAIVAIGWISHTISIVYRYLEAGHPPWTDVYESLSAFGWAGAIVLLFFMVRMRAALLGAIVLPVLFLIMAFGVSNYSSPEIQPPAILNSIWLIIHVSLTLVAYGGFSVAFGLAVLYLLQERNMKSSLKKKGGGGMYKKLPSLETLDTMCYKAVSFAFPFMTFGGLVAGAIWANESWGTYWAWDPKETMSLVTWLIYGGYLHARLTAGWRGKRAAVLSVVGFAAVIFTYFGVGFLLPGLHSYLN